MLNLKNKDTHKKILNHSFIILNIMLKSHNLDNLTNLWKYFINFINGNKKVKFTKAKTTQVL